MLMVSRVFDADQSPIVEMGERSANRENNVLVPLGIRDYPARLAARTSTNMRGF